MMDDKFKEDSLNEIWWQQEVDSEEATRSLISTMRSLARDNTDRRDDFWFFGRLYGGFGSKNLDRRIDKFKQYRENFETPVVRYPLLKEVVDTLQSVVCSSKPKTQYLTDGSIWKQRSLARKINKFNEGVRISQDVQSKAFVEFKKALVLGNGILKFVPDGDYVGIEHVQPYEILVDELDGFYGFPRTFIQVRAVMRTAAKKAFMPKDKDKQAEFLAMIDSLPEADHEDYRWCTHGRRGAILVAEGWHCEDDGEGRHILCLEDGKPIEDEVWEDKYPPFAFGWCEKPMAGFWGSSVSEVVYPLQLEASRLQERNYEANKKFGVPQVFLPANCEIDPEQITNECGAIYKYTGDLPTYLTAPSTNKEYDAAIDKYRMRAFAHWGLDTAFSTGVKPPGLNSGAAMREYVDHASMRLSAISDEWDRFSVEIDRNIIRCAERMHRNGIDVTASTQDGKFMRSIKWSEIRVQENQLTLLPYPINALGATPSSKLDRLMELADRGWIDQRFAKMLSDLPDISGWANLENAPLEFILQVIDEALYEGKKPDAPDKYSLPYIQDLYMPIVIQAIHRGQIDEAPDENVELLRDYVSQMEYLLAPPEMPANTNAMPPNMPQDLPPPDMPPEGMPPLGPEGMPMTPENMPPEMPPDMQDMPAPPMEGAM